uniref:VWFA domain-containing protein n=1 Tax=Parascaris univalens TaxID=6257 RepID=A0A915C6U7_PARUN
MRGAVNSQPSCSVDALSVLRGMQRYNYVCSGGNWTMNSSNAAVSTPWIQGFSMNAPGSVSQNASSAGGLSSSWYNSFSPKTETTIFGNQLRAENESLSRISTTSILTNFNETNKMPHCTRRWKLLFLAYAFIALCIVATVAIILVENLIVRKDTETVITHLSRPIKITFAFNVGFPNPRPFYRNNFVYKSLMPLLAYFNNNDNNNAQFSIETFADVQQIYFTDFTKSTEEILEILQALTSLSLLSSNPDQYSAVTRYKERLFNATNCTYIYILFATNVTDYSMPSIYEEDRHATATVISDIDASDSKVIVIGVKDEFNATNVVLVDAHQSTQRIAAEIVDFCIKIEHGSLRSKLYSYP